MPPRKSGGEEYVSLRRRARARKLRRSDCLESRRWSRRRQRDLKVQSDAQAINMCHSSVALIEYYDVLSRHIAPDG